MKRYIMNSGGKDSMATTILCYEHNIHVDGVVICEPMFDNSRNISAEHPIHAQWLHDIAIPLIEKEFGFKVILLRSDKDYISVFNERVSNRSKYPNRHFKKKGFPLGMECCMRRELKIKPMDKFCRNEGEFEKILGLAYDETKRLERMHARKNEYSILEEFKCYESDTFDICRPYKLLSPYYDLGIKRQGCWFCPNCNIKTFASFAADYPNLWNELRILSKDKETVSPNFKYGLTFDDVDNMINCINNQINIFDLYKDL